MSEEIKNEAEAVENVADAEVQSDAETGQAVPDSIGLNDLQLLANIVDLASQRGAFRGNELTQVGAVFDKLSLFLNFVAKQQAEAQEAEAEEGDAEAPAEGE